MCSRTSISEVFEWEGEFYKIDAKYSLCETCIFDNGDFCLFPKKLTEKLKNLPEDPDLFDRGAIKKVILPETEINF